MKRILLLFVILSVSVITTACINNLAIQELNNKAESYLNKGDIEAAICRLKSSLDLDNEVFQTHYNLAVAYNNIGDNEAALAEINKAIELKPDFADAYYTLAVTKETLAYEFYDKYRNSDGTFDGLNSEIISEFNNIAEEAVDAYNTYLAKKPNAQDTQAVNEKITQLNDKIKAYSELYNLNKGGNV